MYSQGSAQILYGRSDIGLFGYEGCVNFVFCGFNPNNSILGHVFGLFGASFWPTARTVDPTAASPLTGLELGFHM